MKKIAVLQSNYIPWKGYFDLIHQVDEFIIYDRMQYTKNDWRNRNKIKTSKGTEWLTIPVRVESLHQKINEIKIIDFKWTKKHRATLQTNYGKAKCFTETKDFIFDLYDHASSLKFLSEINYFFIKSICDYLKINTKISLSTDYNLIEGKTERLVDLCMQANASHYISGPSAKNYIDEKLFVNNGIDLQWMDYSNYKEYQQMNPPFDHAVSILDLIFNEGLQSMEYINLNR
ncbi:WbqC family protein [Flavobacterium poyangense]|uniref:WbqC family protein n=1 Tax=Flavobacterium poyangense TaxID=2204302 RepID=UPI0014227623|nr:WbqC family protein [Flavobacterium sp. JXAS1]